MAAHARRRTDAQQLELYEPQAPGREERQPVERVARPAAPVCAGCRAKEARYGFRDEDQIDRPRTLCFTCFRMAIARRQAIAARPDPGVATSQLALPLSETLHQIDLRRRRAQIAARRALDI